MAPDWDPEESARQTGHAHEIPPNVRPLTPKERVEFAEWAKRRMDEREREQSHGDVTWEATTPIELLGLLAQRVDTAQRYLASNPTSDHRGRMVFWDALTEMHLLIDKIELAMLTELSPQGWKDPDKPDRRRPITPP